MRPMKSALLAGAAILVGTVPAMATDSATEKQKQQYLYDQTLKNEGAAAGQAPAANSGPGVQGPADTRTGPATRAPGGSSADANPGSSSSGASSGEAGSVGNTTTPSQDSVAYRVPPIRGPAPLLARRNKGAPNLNLALQLQAPARPALFLLVLRIGAARS